MQNLISPKFAFILILIFASVLGWLTVEDAFLPLTGIRGVATEVSPSHAAILFESAREIGASHFDVDGFDRFTVLWNDKTLIYAYSDKSSVRADARSLASIGDLRPGQKLVIMPREKAGNVITALEVRILPN